tara:strand:+ start:2877 stop:3602 length:726 start_codon:yes stop_codon:yes gene_type:complete
MKTSLDKFLGGKIKIFQPLKGYRGGIDAVLLASFVNVDKNSKILDLGSGTGLISFCLAYRCSNIKITGIEKNSYYHSLSLKSVQLNKLKSKINFVKNDLKNINKPIFDFIISNPPWFEKNSTYKSDHFLINEARIESLSLDVWIKKVNQNLKTKGSYYTIFPYKRISKLVDVLNHYFNSIEIYPISSFLDTEPNKAIIFAKKSDQNSRIREFGRIIIHKNDKTFMENINNVLSKGMPFTFA